MEFTVGEPMDDAYMPLLEEELSVTGTDLRAPAWRKDDVAPDRDFTVAVVGAGMSGLLAAHRLDQIGVDFVVFDKNDDVGGTWLENSYPGCRVDIPNHFYSYSFAQRNDWPYHFSPQAVLLDYFRACTDELDLRRHIRFGHTVSAMTWDADSATWTLELDTPDGETTFRANAVISAVGQLNRPKFPDIPGRDRFAGPSFHSAEWRHDVDLAGKRVAVIGSGASAVQFVPIIAEQTGHLTIFQRTPNWFFPVPHYHEPVQDGLNWLFTHVPSYAQWYRFFLFWRGAEGLLPACKVDPEWPDTSLSVSELNQEVRDLLSMYLEFEFAERPDLAAKVIPQYPPASKRIVLDNGGWPRTLRREDVTLDTDPIAEITEQGIVTADGVLHEFDVIIYATGFQASRFLTPMKVVGVDGVDLHDEWHGDARAYLGITIPHFPNFFCLYGPNTNIVVNGSIIYFSECEVHYTTESIRLLLETGRRAMDCRPEVHDAYNVHVDAGNLQMAWGVSTVNSWYKNDTGRVAQNWPFSLLEYWQQTRRPDPTDYVLT
jgi:4-hydroxyacetophenone monooxygenase